MLALASDHAPPRTLSRSALEDELETLREENRQLRALLAPVGRLPEAWAVTPHQTRLLAALARGGGRPVSTERLRIALYGFEGEAEISSMRTQLCHIRRRKDLHGLDVRTHYGEGYSMPAEDCARVLAALADG